MSTFETANPDQRTMVPIRIYGLCLFCLFRPITCVSFFFATTIAGINLLALFGTGISYILLLSIFFRAKEIRIDGASFAVFMFFCYAGFSIAWGSELEYASYTMFPILLYFAVRTCAKELSEVKLFIALAIISYIIPVFGSSFMIALGKGLGMTNYWTGLNRYEGMYLRIHTFAHAMLVCVFFYILHLELNNGFGKNQKKFIIFAKIAMAALACSNIFLSGTRTVLLGVSIIIFFYLLGRRSYKLLVGLFIMALIFLLTTSTSQKLFSDVINGLENQDQIDMMGSGRIGIWSNTLTNFMTTPFEEKFIGKGLGREELHQNAFFGASHNDMLSLLTSLGLIGVVIYFAFVMFFVYDIFTSKLKRSLKYLYFGFIAAVMFMNSVSNSYLIRFELSQYFYFFTGLFYVLRSIPELQAPPYEKQLDNT